MSEFLFGAFHFSCILSESFCCIFVFILMFFLFGFGATPRCAQVLLLALCPEFTSGSVIRDHSRWDSGSIYDAGDQKQIRHMKNKCLTCFSISLAQFKLSYSDAKHNFYGV